MTESKKTVSKTRKKPSSKKPPEKEFSLELLSILRRRLGLLFAAAAVGLMGGTAYYLFTPPTFESKTQILLMQNESAAMASQVTSSQGSLSEDLLATHMSILQSKSIVQAALQKEYVAQESAEATEQTISQALAAQLADKSGEPDESEVLGYVIENLYVTRGGQGASRGARILSLAFRHSNPHDSKVVVEALYKTYAEFVNNKFNEINAKAIELVNDARTVLEDDIDLLTSEYKQFRSESPILSTSVSGANIYAMRYDEISAELATLMIAIDESRGRLELVTTRLAELDATQTHQLEKLALIDERNAERLGILVTVDRGEAQSAAFQALQPERMAGATTEYSSLLVLKGQLTQAKRNFGPKHPEVKALETQIEEIEDFFKGREDILGVKDDKVPLTPDDIMKAYVSLLTNDLRAQEKRKQDLETQLTIASEKAKELEVVALDDERLVEKLTRAKDLHSSVVERLRDLNMQQNSSALIMEAIEEPTLGSQVAPKPAIAAAIALVAAMFLGGATIVIAELTDKSIHSAKELETIYNSNIVCHLPDFKTDTKTRQLMKKIEKSNSPLSSSLICQHDLKSRISEVFRNVRTQLLFRLKGAKNTIAITSASQSDGKSTVTANLAVTFAQAGKSVLLIDADMRRPNVHTFYGLSNELGLVDVISGRSELCDSCQAGPTEGLTILTAGSIPENPAEILASDQFSALLETAREQYDYVLLDCPPVLPVSDPCIIAPMVDAVLVVSSLSADGLPEAKQCKRLLDSVKAPIAGIIVNRAGTPGVYYEYSGYDSKYMSYEANERKPVKV